VKLSVSLCVFVRRFGYIAETKVKSVWSVAAGVAESTLMNIGGAVLYRP
jgi:hypothetical protein